MSGHAVGSALELLQSVEELRIEERRCEQRMEELKSRCEHVTGIYGAYVPGGGGDVHRDRLLLDAAEQAALLRDRAVACMRRIALAEELIAALPDVRQRMVLRLRYVDGLIWDEVIAELKTYGLSYEKRQIYRLHTTALREAEKHYPAFAANHQKETLTPASGRQGGDYRSHLRNMAE